MDDDLAYFIRFCAHQIWIEGGCQNGVSLDLWAAADREMKENGVLPVMSVDDNVAALSDQDS